MAWTKRLLVQKAYGDLGLAAYAFDLSPDEMEDGVLTMDAMMASWEAEGIRLGYQATLDPLSADPDQDSGLPDWANTAVYKNLAIQQASAFGKAVNPSLAVAAKRAFDAMVGLLAANNVPQMQFKGNLPIGAGWKRATINRGPFVPAPQAYLTTGPDGLLELDGPVPLGPIP